jgi:hypothetical protein
MRVIETNLSCNDKWDIKDYQSRIVEIPNWDSYVALFDSYLGKANGRDFKSTMIGCVLPNDAVILNVEHDDFHLKCKFKLYNGFNIIKLAYLIR